MELHTGGSWAGRVLLVCAVGALVSALLPAAASADLADACSAAGDRQFDDVSEGGVFAEEIACLAGYGIVQGRTEDQYVPSAVATRGEAAVHVAEFLEAALGEPLPKPESSAFTDVDGDREPFGPAILKLWGADVVDGVSEQVFAPERALTRGQVAKVLHDALTGVLGVGTDDTSAGYDDVESGSPFAPGIDALTNAGVVRGTGSSQFSPESDITRGELAGFIAGAVVLADDAGAFASDDDRDTPEGGGNVLDVVPTESYTLRPGETLDYTVTGLDDDTGYRVTLFEGENLSGSDTFADADGDDRADAGTVTSRITAVNGTAVADGEGSQTVPAEDADPAGSNGVTPVDGTVTFEVTAGDTAETFIPVIFENPGPGGTTRLDLDDDDVPVDPYGLRGFITVEP